MRAELATRLTVPVNAPTAMVLKAPEGPVNGPKASMYGPAAAMPTRIATVSVAIHFEFFMRLLVDERALALRLVCGLG